MNPVVRIGLIWFVVSFGCFAQSYGKRANTEVLKAHQKTILKLFPRLKKQLKNSIKRRALIELEDIDPMHDSATKALKGMDPFLRKYVDRFAGGENFVELMIDVRSPEFVTVYRGLAWYEEIDPQDWYSAEEVVRDLSDLDLDANYNKKVETSWFSFGLDCVADSEPHAIHYVTANEHPGILVRYDLPALLLSYDETTGKKEPSYVIDPVKLKKYGIQGVSDFVTGIATISDEELEKRDCFSIKPVWISFKQTEKVKENASCSHRLSRKRSLL